MNKSKGFIFFEQFNLKQKFYTYAITKRLQGYHLLKNPKGTSAYEVNMIKNSENIGYNLDRFSSYTRISKNFTTGQTVKNIYQSADRCFSPTKQGNKKRKIRLYNRKRKTVLSKRKYRFH